MSDKLKSINRLPIAKMSRISQLRGRRDGNDATGQARMVSAHQIAAANGGPIEVAAPDDDGGRGDEDESSVDIGDTQLLSGAMLKAHKQKPRFTEEKSPQEEEKAPPRPPTRTWSSIHTSFSAASPFPNAGCVSTRASCVAAVGRTIGTCGVGALTSLSAMALLVVLFLLLLLLLLLLLMLLLSLFFCSFVVLLSLAFFDPSRRLYRVVILLVSAQESLSLAVPNL